MPTVSFALTYQCVFVCVPSDESSSCTPYHNQLHHSGGSSDSSSILSTRIARRTIDGDGDDCDDDDDDDGEAHCPDPAVPVRLMQDEDDGEECCYYCCCYYCCYVHSHRPRAVWMMAWPLVRHWRRHLHWNYCWKRFAAEGPLACRCNDPDCYCGRWVLCCCESGMIIAPNLTAMMQPQWPIAGAVVVAEATAEMQQWQSR